MNIKTNYGISSLYKFNDYLEASISLDYISFYKIRDRLFFPSGDTSLHFQINRSVLVSLGNRKHQ